MKNTRLIRESASQASFYISYTNVMKTIHTGVRATINKATLIVNKI